MDEHVYSEEDLFEEYSAKGLNPARVVLFVVVGLALIFILGNYALYMYARKTIHRKKKTVSKKKMKKEWLKKTLSSPAAS